MPRKKTTTAPLSTGNDPTSAAASSGPRPRLHKLRVSNFRCIGPVPVEIELDEIVVLVGPNNAGKSSILRAYEIVMEAGNEGAISQDDFPSGKIDGTNRPTIELDTVVFPANKPGDKWVFADLKSGDLLVRERWIWETPGKPTRTGWIWTENQWADEGVPWGAAGVAQAYRAQPHRVGAFHKPEEQAAEVVGLLKEALTARVKELSKKKTDVAAGESPTDYEQLLDSVRDLQKAIAIDATNAVNDVQKQLEETIGSVFPGYGVTFDARPEDDIEKTISLFKTAPLLKMGPQGGYQATIDRQGSGACRTLIWAALRILSDRPTTKAATVSERTHLLLMDEPEICLHPDAIREACRVLYDLPKTKNWQVMITTHSPVFIDLSRDNTSIVRVERTPTGVVQGTTVFRPKKANLGTDDKEELKLLNICDPHVAEFFFGGRTIVVEGDTEYTAFRYCVATDPAKYKDVHVVRARGKACIKSLCKILNQFEKNYAVLHDSDREKIKYKKKPGEMTNPMWTENQSILDITEGGRADGKILLVASVPNFEEAFFKKVAEDEKPYGAWRQLRTDRTALASVTALLDSLIDNAKASPPGAVRWSTTAELAEAVKAFDLA